MNAPNHPRARGITGFCLIAALLGVAACGEPAPAAPAAVDADAAVWPDASQDSAVDSWVDGAVDAAVDSTGDGPADVASSDTAEDLGAAASAWCESWAGATCALWAKCPLAASGQAMDGCAARLTLQCQGGAALGKALQAKALAFDPDQAKICLEGQQKLQCVALYQGLVDAGQAAVPACAKVWKGLVSAGGSCVLGGECQAGTRCVFGAACPGKCAAWSPVGGACSDDQPCDPESASCTAGKCAALPNKAGQSCPAGLCAAPLYCGGDGKCAAFALETAACGAGGPVCWPSLGCWAAQGQAGTCKIRGGAGSPCLSQANCAVQADGAVLVCIAGSCQPAPGPGKPCFDWQCQGGWCDSQALPPTCVAWPAPGKACPQGWCGPGAVCLAGVCQAQLEVAKPCSAPQQCQSGQCWAGKCAAAGVSPCL
jgi:hypothetical protein